MKLYSALVLDHVPEQEKRQLVSHPFNLTQAVTESLGDVILGKHGKLCGRCARGNLNTLCDYGRTVLYPQWETLNELVKAIKKGYPVEKFLHTAPPSPFLDCVQDRWDYWLHGATAARA